MKIKELIGYIIDTLGESGFGGVYAVFEGLPHVLVVAEADVYRVMLWKDGVKLRITLRKDTLEPLAVTLET